MSTANSGAGKYTHIWQKYRPVILSLMVSAPKGPQSYSLSSHEFMDVNNKKTTGYSFALKVYQNRNNSEKKVNVVGLDLLAVLQYSQKAQELTNEGAFSFEMDKNFKLQVSYEPVADEEGPLTEAEEA